MSDALILTLIQRALETLMWVTAPLLAAAIVVGVAISLLQTLTSIQDQTFSFAPRVASIFLVFLLLFPFGSPVLRAQYQYILHPGPVHVASLSGSFRCVHFVLYKLIEPFVDDLCRC